MKRRKTEPAPLTLTFSTIADPSEPGVPKQYFIDLSQCASLVNRRFYRQGLNWAVAGIKIISPTTSNIYVHKLPATWIMSNSWHKGFAAWQKMNREALEEAESVRPRFLDFKIYANSRHHNVGFGSNLLPMNVSTDAAGVVTVNQAVPGEWESSKYQIPDNTLGATGGVREREVIAVGANFPGAGASGLNAVSLIEGYAASRGLPNVLDPNVPADAGDVVGSGENWISQLDSEGTQQIDSVIDDMISENNIAPYPFENDGVHIDTMYPGGANQLSGLELHDQSSISATTIGGMTRIQGGSFPCGLIAITDESSASQSIGIQLELLPGPHRGYLAMPMQEM